MKEYNVDLYIGWHNSETGEDKDLAKYSPIIKNMSNIIIDFDVEDLMPLNSALNVTYNEGEFVDVIYK